MENYINELNELKEQVKKLERRSSSTELNELFTALAKTQSEMKSVKTNKKGKHSSPYADLKAVFEASQPLLSKNGLCVMQIIESCEGNTQFMITKLCHASGQWIESRVKLLPADSKDLHAFGSNITYVRRYMYSSLVGIATTEEDDDGDCTYKSKDTKVTNYSTSPTLNVKMINADQIVKLETALQGAPLIKKELLKTNNIESFSLLEVSKFDNLYRYILQEKQKAM